MTGASPRDSALFTDFYSLTMAQGYWKKGMNNRAVFEMVFRTQPFDGGFSIFAGLGTLIEKLKAFTFSADDLLYLDSLNFFEPEFLTHLKTFRFSGSLWAMDEGTVVFPNEPLIRVEGRLIECQLIEGLLLNVINFQSLIATKTARVWLASGKGTVMEFGLRRAQGPDGAMSASRAAYIGGAAGTSNVLAGKEFGIPVMGTMAHSWIMAWGSEEEAFRAYAEMYPEKTTFLIDTYDTLKSGLPNAIKVGKTLATQGKRFGVRLDSGDIHYLSTEVRRALDAAGLKDATIAVSNDLDESIIKALTESGAPVNAWGVGTHMVTGGTQGAFNGVYKLTASEDETGKLSARVKFSDNPEKTSNPGVKQVWRIHDADGLCVADVLTLDDSLALKDVQCGNGCGGDEILEKGKTYSFWHPSADYRRFTHTLDGTFKPLLSLRLFDGNSPEEPGLKQIRENVCAGLETFDVSYKRLLNPHIYKVSISGHLRELKLQLIKNHLGDL
ncbi:MAG: nicotinate phosphoribosyltransferase [Treponema sp.]|jgi:nicotinate phosphoribosyltransferase|nr:nicotinate phosphoribosyltransferase [Treponema sp.]